MKGLIALVAVAAVALVYFGARVPETTTMPVDHIEKEFFDFINHHGRNFATEQEYHARFANFKKSFETVSAHNTLKGRAYEMEINHMSDLHYEEYQQLLGLDLTIEDGQDAEEADFSQVLLSDEDSIDWRERGAVTDIKDQGSCGSCWAFSATGAMEGSHFIATGELVDMSESLLVDCNYGIFSNHACQGGLMNSAFKYLTKHHEITTEEYPYTPKHHHCKASEHVEMDVIASTYKKVKKNKTSEMKKALLTHPLAIGVSAGQDAFRYYSGGIMNNCVKAGLDHGIVAIGFGFDAEHGDYYIVKNSWGKRWGEKGYARIAPGNCGVEAEASFPITN